MTQFHDDLPRFETERLVALMNMGARLGRLVDGAGKLIPIRRSKPQSKG